MSRDTLRDKQNQEVLDVWKNLNSQVVGLQKRQVAVFPESVLPKTQRDLGVEVNVDKTIESVNRSVESKLGQLELFIRSLSGVVAFPTSAPFLQAFQTIINTGDVVPLWNSVVRFYQTQGLSKQTQEMIKVKVQELTPNLDAMVYGLNQAIDEIFQTKEHSFATGVGFKIFELLRSLSLYTLIQNQVNTRDFEMITVDLMDRSFKNIFAELSQDRRERLGEYAPKVVRGVPVFESTPANFAKRIKDLEEELGFKFPPATKLALRKLSQNDLERQLSKVRSEIVPQANQHDTKLLERAREVANQLMEMNWRKGLLGRRVRSLQNQIGHLKRAVDTDSEVEGKEEVLTEMPLEPVEPDIMDYLMHENLNAYKADREKWSKEMDEYLRILGERIITEDYNRYIQQAQKAKSEAERETLLKEKEERFHVLRDEHISLQDEITALEGELATLHDEMDEQPRFIQQAFVALLNNPQLKKQQTTGFSVLPVGQGKPSKGRDIDTRGLSTLRSHYGVDERSDSDKDDDESESDKDEMDFDDRRNEMYTTRPK